MDDQRTDREVSGVRYRKLRIAWSVGWGILCLLLIVLWVRSHFVFEGLCYGTQTATAEWENVIKSDNGTLAIYSRRASSGVRIKDGWTYGKLPWEYATIDTFDWFRNDEGFFLRFPTLIPAMLFALAAFAPKLTPVIAPWLHFSLRTLLIGMTVLAALLGLIVWAMRSTQY
jgi:hypothetical protein